MSKYLIGILLLLIPSLSNAADITTTTCPGVGCVDYNVSAQASVGIQITGTWSGTITFQSSVDNSNFTSLLVAPSNSVTAVSTTTANGLWQGGVPGIRTIRVVFTSWVSGTATINVRLSTLALKGGGSAGGGSGTVTSIATTSPITGGTITSTGTIACATCGVTGSPLSQFASTTSAQLLATLSDETGSGLAVFGTNPTLTIGTNKNVCFSDGGTLVCNDSDITFDKATNLTTLTNLTTSHTGTTYIGGIIDDTTSGPIQINGVVTVPLSASYQSAIGILGEVTTSEDNSTPNGLTSIYFDGFFNINHNVSAFYGHDSTTRGTIASGKTTTTFYSTIFDTRIFGPGTVSELNLITAYPVLRTNLVVTLGRWMFIDAPDLGTGATMGTWNAIEGADLSGLTVSGTKSFITYASGKFKVDADGDILSTGNYIENFEVTAPSAPAANGARLFVQDNGSGKTQVCARFNTGAIQCFATQP